MINPCHEDQRMTNFRLKSVRVGPLLGKTGRKIGGNDTSKLNTNTHTENFAFFVSYSSNVNSIRFEFCANAVKPCLKCAAEFPWLRLFVLFF